MTITFNGRDLVARFKEDPDNQAVRQYRIEYECKNGTVTHYVKVDDSQGNDVSGLRFYKDVLTFAENEAAGLTRTPRVTFYSQDANLNWSSGALIEAQNPLPVLPAAPSVTSTLTGFELRLQAPADGDLEGYAVYVSTDPSVPMTALTERYRGRATSIPVQLGSDETFYVRVVPFDAFGLDFNSSWTPVLIKRGDLDVAVKQTGTVQDIIAQTAEAVMAAGQASTIANQTNSDLAKAKTDLSNSVAGVRTDVDKANTEVATVRSDLATYKSDTNAAVVDAKKAGTDAATAAQKAATDLGSEVARAKNAEGSLRTVLVGVQQKSNDNTVAISDEVTARASETSALANRAQKLEALTGDRIKGNAALSATIEEEGTTRANADEALGTQISTVISQANKDRSDYKALVSSETLARTTKDDALSNRLDTVEAEYVTQDLAYGYTNSKVSGEASARANADYAIGQRVDSVVTQANTDRADFNSAIQSEQTTRASQTDALGKRVDSVTAQANTDRSDYLARISSEETARATVDQALSDKVDVVEAKLRGDQDSGIAAQVRTEAAARVSADSANADRSTALETRMTTQEGYANAINAKVDTNETASVNRDNAITSRTSLLETQYGGVVSLLDNGNFDNGTVGWDNIPGNLVVPSSGGRTNVIRTAPGTKYNGVSGPKFYVNSDTQRFKLRLGFRCAAGVSNYYFGVLFYTADGGSIYGVDGTGNYPLGAGFNVDASTNSGWIDREVIIGKGTVDPSPYGGNAFIPAGTVYCRPVMFINYQDSPDAVTEVDYFTVEDVTSNQSTLARLKTEEATRTSQTSALATRADALESSVNTGPNNLTSLAGRISDEATARAQNDGVITIRVQTVEAKAKNVATSFTAVSRGNGAVAKFGKGSGIYNVDGGNFTGGGRGYRVNVFDSGNNLIASNLYDTLSGDRGFSLGGAPEMANFLNGITEGQAVIITTDDEPMNNRLTAGLVEAMERCGAGPLFSSPKFAYRGAYILVGQAGIGKGNGNEYYSGTGDNAPDAWIEARFDLLAGRPQLNGAGKAITETNAAIKAEESTRATAVDAVSSRLGTVEASYTTGGNLLSNTDFAYDMTGWNYGQEAATGAGRDALTPISWWPAGLHALVMAQENTSGNRAGYFVQDVWGIEAGKNYQATVYGASHRCQVSIYIDCYNALGEFLGTTQSTLVEYAGNDNYAPLTSWWRHKLDFVTPVNTSRLRFHLMKYGTTSGGNSYAWFIRPQLVQTRPGVTAAVPYVPGSGDQGNLAANARISDEATTRANADSAQVGRIATTEAQLAGSQGSWMSTRISDVDTASVNRYNTNANRATTLEAAALVGSSAAKNDKFAMWRDGQQHPDAWMLWNAEGNYRTERVAGNGGSPYAVRTLNDNANAESGFYQQVPIYAGKWVVEVTAESDVSGFSGAGMTLHGVFNIDFLSDADTKGLVGDQGSTMRTWNKAFDFDQTFVNNVGGMVNFHAMVGWTGFGRYRAAKYMKWHKMSLKPVGYADAEAIRANARVTDLSTVVTNNNSALAARSSALEVSMGRGDFLNRNAMFNEPWDGNGLPPAWGIWSQSGGGYYGRWPNGSGLYGQYGFQWDRQGQDTGFWQQVNGQFPIGWYVLDCEVRLEDGPTQGSGFHANFMNGYADQVNFLTEQDATEATGQRNNGNYKFTKLIWNGAQTTQINLHPMPGWGQLSGYTGFLRTIWFKAGIRPASVQEVKSGKVDNLSARVTTNESAVANLNGRTAAYFSKSVAVPGAEAFIMANAINDAGQATSNVAIGGTNIALYNTQDGTAKRAMYLLAGNATFDGMITARTGIRIGDGTWQVAVSPKDFRVSNGTVVNYGYDLGRVPNITFGPCPVSLNTGEVYQAYAENSTSTGFTARLVIQGSPTAASQSTGGGYSYNGNQGYQVEKSGPDATNGTYTINASGTFTASAYYDGSGDCVHIDAWTSQDKQAGDVQQGDLILILNEDGSYYEEQHVQNNYIASAHCVRITTASGIQLTLSETTPVTLRDLSVVSVREVVGQELAVLDEGDFRWETVTTLEEIGLQPVAHISALDGTYAAGDVKGRMIFTHNIYYKP